MPLSLPPLRRHLFSKRSQRGFAILELTITLFLLVMLVGLLIQFLLTANHVATNQKAGMSLQMGSQYNLDVMTEDIQGADLILATYTNGSTTYTADNTTTLILRTLSLNAAQTAATTTEDHIIYTVVATAAGDSSGPYTLNRTVVPASGSGRAAVNNVVVATNLQSITFGYVGAQTQTQASAGTAKSFTLANSAVYATQSGVPAIGQAIVQGTDLCAGSSCYSGSTVTTPSAPAANTLIDFRFSVSPTATVSSTALTAANVTCASGESATFAKELIVTITSLAATGSGNSVGGIPPTMTLTTTAAARNKAVF